MKTTTGKIINISLAIAGGNFIIAGVSGMNNNMHLELLLITGALVLLVFTGTALYEIYKSLFITRKQKIILSLGFFCLPSIMNLLYFFMLRKKIRHG